LAKQLTLDLPLRPALGRDDFLVTETNRAAVALIDQWPEWPVHAAVLIGPAGSGKTHLAEVWRQRSDASRGALNIEAVPSLMAGGACVIEDLDRSTLDETALFHLLNVAQQDGGSVLLTASAWPLAVTLPDLASRLRALPFAAILPPDDELLRGVLVKLFDDRQIGVDEGLITYLMARMPRSLDMARRVVAEIDAIALEQGAEVTKSFAGRVLAGLESPTLL
jgi:chromosomal replication initiation ATPase DnaA